MGRAITFSINVYLGAFARKPSRHEIARFAKLLLQEAEVAVAPGIGFGSNGEGFVRIAMVENKQRIRQASKNIKTVFERIIMESLRVGVAGLGTVGVGVVKTLTEHADVISARTGKKILVTAVSARSKTKDRGIDVSEYPWITNPVAMADANDVDVVVELMGGDAGDAKTLCENAIANGKHVVTANKALIAHHGAALAESAEQNNVVLAFEAAVAGGIPIIKTVKEGLAANHFSRILGIMNGTCNYMLTSMRDSGRQFEDILCEAQQLGYAEADPSFDVDGIDTAHKLAILTSLAFGTKVDFANVYVEGIRDVTPVDIHYANELGYQVKLLGICEEKDGKIIQYVYPTLVKEINDIAKVDGVYNAVLVEGEPIGSVMCQGPGAGEGPTASSVVADIMDIACGVSRPAFGRTAKGLRQGKFVSIEQSEHEYFIRIPVKDQSGVLAGITDVFRDNGVSIEAVIQKPSKAEQDVDVILLTHHTKEKVIREVLTKVAPLAVSAPRRIRILT